MHSISIIVKFLADNHYFLGSEDALYILKKAMEKVDPPGAVHSNDIDEIMSKRPNLAQLFRVSIQRDDYLRLNSESATKDYLLLSTQDLLLILFDTTIPAELNEFYKKSQELFSRLIQLVFKEWGVKCDIKIRLY